MGSGGQAGIKKKLKETVQQPGFVYSSESIAEAIHASAELVCVEEANRFHRIKDNSVKYILSREAITNIEIASNTSTIDLPFVQDIVQRFPSENPRYASIENDMVAFIRNERQILYYYGYFHSKSSGANDFEYSSLTPIGELALKANANEFLAIWEHQKVKMISQPATADINNLPANIQGDNFSISYRPYTDILGHLKRRSSLSFDEYQYLVSRKRHVFSADQWEESEAALCANIQQTKDRVETFGRARDIATEDCQKELKKYLLGIRADLPVDHGTNAFNACELGNSAVEVTDASTVALLYAIYSKLDDYKVHRYQVVFDECETDLRRRYIASCAGESLNVDSRVKIHWDLYNIRVDKLILMGTMFAIVATKLNITNIDVIDTAQQQAICEAYTLYFPNLLREVGINTQAKIRREVRMFIAAFRSADYSAYIPNNDNEREQILARYREVATDDLRVRIEDISATAIVSQTAARERNSNLISMLKSYYIQRFAQDNNILTCECCGEQTFITEAGEPYVEFHHVIPFSIAYGPDHYLNLYALCPNCHRKIHFMNLEVKGEQYRLLDENNYLRLELTERLRQLKAQNLLRSYHLEYLLADHAITEAEYTAIAA